MECLGQAEHTEGGHRALLGHPGRLQTGEAAPTLIRRGEAQGHRRGGAEALGGRIHQGSIPSRVVSQSCISKEEKWKMEDVRRLHRVK